jgi:hypothetical protein
VQTSALARNILLVVLFACMTFLPAERVDATTSTTQRAVELTFLKSKPGQREALKRFIVQNWFAMDKIAKQQGLMHAYTVMDTGTDDGAWNIVVSVTYQNDKGYDGIKDAFEKIRSGHQTILVDGKTLTDLGAVVDSKRLFEDRAHASR